MAADDDEIDRAAILRRRALFVASALASVTAVRGARADEPPAPAAPPAPSTPEPAPPTRAPPADCPAPREPSANELAEARARFDAGTHLYEEGEFESAAIELVRVYAVVPRTKAAYSAAQALLRARDPARAHRIVSEHLRCREDDAALREMLQKIEAESATVEVHLQGYTEGAQVVVDDREVGTDEVAKGIFVAPGRHTVVVRGPGSLLQKTIEVTAGERLDLVMDIAVPMPCLSPLPCLQPWPPPPRERPSVDYVPALGVVVAPLFEAAGPTARLGVVVSADPEVGVIDVVIEPGASALAGDRPVAVFDATFLVRGWATESVWLGAGGHLGVAVYIGDAVHIDDSTEELVPLVGPAADTGIAVGPMRLGLRVPVWIGPFRSEPLIVVAPQFLLGVSIGDLTADDDDEKMMGNAASRDVVSAR